MQRREVALQILCAKLANPKLTDEMKEKHHLLYIKEAFVMADKFLNFQSQNEGKGPFNNWVAG